jgi:hypothetical protein
MPRYWKLMRMNIGGLVEDRQLHIHEETEIDHLLLDLLLNLAHHHL